MSLPKYPEYRVTDSKLVAEVPKDWQLVPLRRLLPVIESGTSVNALDNQPEEGKPSVLKTSCVYTSCFRREECKEIVEEELGRATCPVKKDSLIVSRMNTPDLVGAAGLADSDIDHLYLPDRLWQVRIGELIPAFAYYWTQSRLYRDQVKAACSGTSSSMQNLSQEAFVSFFLCRPESEEQNQIVSFLDRETAKIDALIAEQQRLIELLQEKRQAVISHAVTKGLNPNAPMKDSGVEWLGEVPEHWEVKPMRHTHTKKSGGTPSKAEERYWQGGGIPWASSKDLKQDKIDDTIDHITEAAVSEGAAELRPAGTVLICVRGMILAHTFPVTIPTVPMSINQDLKALIPCKGVSAEYMAAMLRGASKEVLARVDEAAHGTKVLRMNDFDSFVVAIPPLEEQETIIQFINKESEAIAALQASSMKSAHLLAERRSALISAAVTGQIDVRGLAQETEEQ